MIYLETFLDQASKGKTSIIRYVVGIFIIYFFIYVVGAAVQFLVAMAMGSTVELGRFNISSISPLAYFVVTMCPAICGIIGVFISVRFIHQRPFSTLVTPFKKINKKPILYGFGFFFILLVVSDLILGGLNSSNIQFNANNISQWLYFLPFILILIPLQTTSEELTYRGYWMQGTGLITRNFFILALVNGILFLLPHIVNPEITTGGILAMVYYVVVGFSLAYITLKSGTLELAIGMHAANNIYESAIIHPQASILQTPSLFTQAAIDPIYELMAIIAIMVVFYLVTFKIKPQWKRC